MSTRYTVSLPTELYNELKMQSESQNVSIRDVLIRCIKVGLVAMKTDTDPDMEIIVREYISGEDESRVSKETRLIVL